MSAVEGRNGQNVHESEYNRQKCSDVPESEPVPFVGEYAADGSESAKALCTFFGEHQLHL